MAIIVPILNQAFHLIRSRRQTLPSRSLLRLKFPQCPQRSTLSRDIGAATCTASHQVMLIHHHLACLLWVTLIEPDIDFNILYIWVHCSFREQFRRCVSDRCNGVNNALATIIVLYINAITVPHLYLFFKQYIFTHCATGFKSFEPVGYPNYIHAPLDSGRCVTNSTGNIFPLRKRNSRMRQPKINLSPKFLCALSSNVVLCPERLPIPPAATLIFVYFGPCWLQIKA